MLSIKPTCIMLLLFLYFVFLKINQIIYENMSLVMSTNCTSNAIHLLKTFAVYIIFS